MNSTNMGGEHDTDTISTHRTYEVRAMHDEWEAKRREAQQYRAEQGGPQRQEATAARDDKGGQWCHARGRRRHASYLTLWGTAGR